MIKEFSIFSLVKIYLKLPCGEEFAVLEVIEHFAPTQNLF